MPIQMRMLGESLKKIRVKSNVKSGKWQSGKEWSPVGAQDWIVKSGSGHAHIIILISQIEDRMSKLRDWSSL